MTEEQAKQGRVDLVNLKGKVFGRAAARREMPEFVQAADQTTRTALSAKDGEPVVLNVVGEDVLAGGKIFEEMVERAVPFLRSRNIYLRFGKIVDGQFVVDETYSRLNSGAPKGPILRTYLGSKESLAKLDLPPEAGIGLVRKEEGRLIRLLDTFVKMADIKRNGDIESIRQNISGIADPFQVKTAPDQEALFYLHRIPADFNERKEAYLQRLEPFTIVPLRFTFEETVGYAQMVMRAVGAAA